MDDEYVHCKECNSPGYWDSEGWFHVYVEQVSSYGLRGRESYALCIQCGEARGHGL